jgi:hypothetical protein
VVVNSDLTIHYRPDSTFSGVDLLTYTIEDDQGKTASALIYVLEAYEPALSGDFTGDGRVAFDDFLRFVQGYGRNVADSEYGGDLDFDGNGQVDFSDFVAFSRVFGDGL